MSSDTGTVASARQDEDSQLEMWQDMVAVERERIASRDRATDVMHKAIDKQNADSQRYHEYATERLRRDDEHRQDRFRHARNVTWAFIVSAAAMTGIVLFMAFWGTDPQRNTAQDFVGYAFSLVSGLGLGYFLGRRHTG